MSKSLIFGSLFSGCGLMDLGLHRAGLRCAWQCEIDPHARRVLAHHWPDVPCHEDVRCVGAHNLAPVDVLAGGFPCQDVSVAGQRAGIQSGKRSGLFWEMLRVLKELQPRILLFENVPGLSTSDGGRDLWRICSALAEHNYFGVVRTLDSKYYGVPQTRRRLFGVFVRGDSSAGCAAEILALAQGRQRHLAPHRQKESEVASTLRGSSRGPGVNGPGEHLVARCVTAREGSRLDGESCTFVTHPLASGDDGCGQPPTLANTSCSKVRYLMPVECLRLMGGPDNWLDLDPPLSDTAKYRLIGNGVVVPVVFWIGTRIVRALQR